MYLFNGISSQNNVNAKFKEYYDLVLLVFTGGLRRKSDGKTAGSIDVI